MEFVTLHKNYEQRLSFDDNLSETEHTKRNTQLRDYGTRCGLTHVKLVNLIANVRVRYEDRLSAHNDISECLRITRRRYLSVNTAAKAKKILMGVVQLAQQARRALAIATHSLKILSVSPKSPAFKLDQAKALVKRTTRQNNTAFDLLNAAFVKHANLDLKTRTEAELTELTRFSTLSSKTNSHMYQR